MPPEERIQAVCAMSVETWGVRRRARGLRVTQVGIGGAAAPGDATIVISAGLCGGLLADQAPGTVVIATSVSDETGATHGCDPQVAARLERAARSLGFPVVTGSLVSTSALVTGSGRDDWARRGHVAVDMEFGCRGGDRSPVRHGPRHSRHTAPRALARVGEPWARGP